jgi:DNA-binding XRE family transcriptional regulator
MVADTIPIPTQIFLLGQDTYRFSCVDALHPTILSSHGQWCEHVSHVGRTTLWISERAQFTCELLQCVAKPVHFLGDALLFYEPTAGSMPVLSTYFRRTVFGAAENFLPTEELAEVLLDNRKADLVIGGIVDHCTQNITLWRGSFEFLAIPFTAFTRSGNGVYPDFTQFRVTDYGQTIQLGAYEAATEALLYEFDADYRRRIAKERRASDQSFGAALRRLRKQRSLRREDFAPLLSPKTIARIERGEVLPDNIHASTWEILSQKLGVKPEEIGTF